MVLNIDAKCKGKLTCAFKNVMRNLANFHQITFKSLKIGTLMESFYPKRKTYELKIYKGDMSWQWIMIQNLEKNWLVSSKLTWGIWWILTRPLKVSKICTLINYFWQNKYRGLIFDGTEDWYKNWRKADLCFLKWHEEFRKFSITSWKIWFSF